MSDVGVYFLVVMGNGKDTACDELLEGDGGGIGGKGEKERRKKKRGTAGGVGRQESVGDLHRRQCGPECTLSLETAMLCI